MQTLNTKKPVRGTPRKLPLILLVVSLILFIFGINSGEPSSVWEKAVRICLSCIGIG